MQKIVGHTRLLMTLYYTKPGASFIHKALADAIKGIDSRKAVSITDFLSNTSREELIQHAIANDPSSLRAAIPEHPAFRNPAGWILMHHGLCLAGGNTTGMVEGTASLPGCHNGGQQIQKSRGEYGPVPGGTKNCVRCRWFVTEPHYVPALVAHWNNLAYHLWNATERLTKFVNQVQGLDRERYHCDKDHKPFVRQREWLDAQEGRNHAVQLVDQFILDMSACWQLIQRCHEALQNPRQSGQHLIMAGQAIDAKTIIGEVPSELLHLCTICQNAEIYQALDPGRAVVRRAQLLDMALRQQGKSPLFLALSEEEQQRAGNAFIRALAQKAHPKDSEKGLKRVVSLLDQGKSIYKELGIDLDTLLKPDPSIPVTSIRIELKDK